MLDSLQLVEILLLAPEIFVEYMHLLVLIPLMSVSHEK
jgi:hypothetical protein